MIRIKNKKDYLHFEMEDDETSWIFNGGIFSGIFETDNALLENYQILFEDEYAKILRKYHGFGTNMKLLAINWGNCARAPQESAGALMLKSIRKMCILKVDAIAWAPGLTEIDQGMKYINHLECYFKPVAQTGILIMDPNKKFPSGGLELVQK